MLSQPNMDVSRDSGALPKDGVVLFDLEHDRLLKLNSVGAEMWQQLRAGNSESQVIHSVAKQYGVDKETVAKDLHALLRRCKELGVEPGRSSVAVSQKSTAPGDASFSYPSSAQDGTALASGPTTILVLCAILGLALFDLILWMFSLSSLCRTVQRWPLKWPAPKDESSVTRQVCNAVEKGCVWYPRKALCLQRSAVTACLLRRRGIAASMVVGARPMPFLAHAWVEVGGSVVNDSPGVKRLYNTLSSY